MSTPTPPPGLPPKPPLTLTPRAPQATPPAVPAAEPDELPTFGTAGIPLATALLRLGLPLLVVAAVVLFSLFSSTIGLILGGAVLLAGVVAVVLPAARSRSGLGRAGGRSGMRRPGGRPGGGRLGRLLSGGRPGGLRSRLAGGLGRARNGRFASRLRSLAGGRPGASRPGGSGRPGGSRASRLLAKGRSLLPTGRTSRRSGSRAAGGRPGGLGRFLPRGASGARAAHGSTGRPGRRPGGKAPGGSRPGGGSTPSRRRGLLGTLTGGRLGRPGPGGRKPSGGAGGKRPGGKAPGGKRPGSSGGSRGKGKPTDWGTGGVETVTFGLVRGFLGLSRFVGNRVRSVDGGAVMDALKTPFQPGPPKPFTTGIDDESDPMPDWWPGQTAADYVWPGQSTVDDYAWPKDHDKRKTKKEKKKEKEAEVADTSPHSSPHPPEQREHHEIPTVTRRTSMATDVTDYSSHFEELTEESTAADRKAALNEAASDASSRWQKQNQEAERLRADARAAAKFPDRVAELNTKAAELEGDAEKNRLLSSHFTTRSAEQTD